MSIAGIILAAGESTRMGKPKALLELSGNKTLLTSQVDLLKLAGCAPVIAVVGCNADKIMSSHPHLEVSWCVNKKWKLGQFVSLQSGISHILNLNPPTPPFNKGGDKLLPPFEKGGMGGILILPIDVVGIHRKTIGTIINETLKHPKAYVITPQYNGCPGHPVFLSTEFAKHILTIDIGDGDARLDRQILKAEKGIRIEINDPQILGNINTKQDWERYLMKL